MSSAWPFRNRLGHRNADAPERQATVLDGEAAEVHGRRADELGDERVRRARVERPRGVELLQPRVPQDGNAVTERHRLGLVVRHVHRRRPEARLQCRDVGPHLHAQLGVEIRQRLVHQEHARLADDRATHRHALPLAAGQLPRLALEVLDETEHRRDFAHSPLAFLLRNTRDPQRERDVRRHREVRIERVVLEDHRDVAVLRSHIRHVALADEDRARVDLLEAGEHAQRGRLSGS